MCYVESKISLLNVWFCLRNCDELVMTVHVYASSPILNLSPTTDVGLPLKAFLLVYPEYTLPGQYIMMWLLRSCFQQPQIWRSH